MSRKSCAFLHKDIPVQDQLHPQRSSRFSCRKPTAGARLSLKRTYEPLDFLGRDVLAVGLRVDDKRDEVYPPTKDQDTESPALALPHVGTRAALLVDTLAYRPVRSGSDGLQSVEESFEISADIGEATFEVFQGSRELVRRKIEPDAKVWQASFSSPASVCQASQEWSKPPVPNGPSTPRFETAGGTLRSLRSRPRPPPSWRQRRARTNGLPPAEA